MVKFTGTSTNKSSVYTITRRFTFGLLEWHINYWSAHYFVALWHWRREVINFAVMVCIRTRHKTPASFFILVFWVKAEEVRHQSHSSIFRLFSARISRWPPKKLYLSWSATFFRFSADVKVRQAFFFVFLIPSACGFALGQLDWAGVPRWPIARGVLWGGHGSLCFLCYAKLWAFTKGFWDLWKRIRREPKDILNLNYSTVVW